MSNMKGFTAYAGGVPATGTVTENQFKEFLRPFGFGEQFKTNEFESSNRTVESRRIQSFLLDYKGEDKIIVSMGAGIDKQGNIDVVIGVLSDQNVDPNKLAIAAGLIALEITDSVGWGASKLEMSNQITGEDLPDAAAERIVQLYAQGHRGLDVLEIIDSEIKQGINKGMQR